MGDPINTIFNRLWHAVAVSCYLYNIASLYFIDKQRQQVLSSHECMRTDTARRERRKNQMIQISPFTLDVLLVFDNPFTVLSFGRESPRAVHISELSITLTIFTAGNYTTSSRRKYYYLIRSLRPRKTHRGNPKDDCMI